MGRAPKRKDGAKIYIEKSNGSTVTIAESKKTVWKHQIVSAKAADIIAEGLQQVVANPSGTAHNAFMKDVPLAGKTGTAELKENQGEKGKENGVFVAYNFAHRHVNRGCTTQP